MQQFDEAVRKTFNLDPVVTTTASSHRTKCTIFEDEPKDGPICSEWYFSAPLPDERIVTVDLQRLLKQFDLSKSGNTETRTLMSQFSNEVNRLKQRCSLEEPSEEDLLCYLNFVDVLNKVFENNTASYSYSVPSTDDKEPYYTIHSDKFLFEYLNVLLALLAHYNNQAVDIRIQRTLATNNSDVQTRRDFSNAEARLFHLATEVLTELLAQCRAPREPHKLVYVEPLRSMNNTSSSSPAQSSSNNLPLKEFVCSFLGGEASIEARLHLCTAKKQEALFDIFMLNSTTLDRQDALAAQLSRSAIIHDAYKQAYLIIADSELNKALYQHCRFMAHMWFCGAHLSEVKASAENLLETLENHEETAAELKHAQDILARLMYVTKEGRIMEEKEKDILDSLNSDQEETFNRLVAELKKLTKSFDVALYDNRRLKETKMKDSDFALPLPQVVKRQQSMFGEARKNAIKKCVDKNPAILQCQQFLRTLLDKLIQGTSNEWLRVFNNTTPSSSIQEEAGPVMDRSIRLGHLKEREWWLEYLLSLYSEIDGEFSSIPDVLYKRFIEELEAVKEAKRLV